MPRGKHVTTQAFNALPDQHGPNPHPHCRGIWQWVRLFICSSLPAHLMQAKPATLRLQVDCSVGGITHTTGGSTAGYTRWEIFKRGGLASYASKRNTAMQRNGVSRLSGEQLHGAEEPESRDNVDVHIAQCNTDNSLGRL